MSARQPDRLKDHDVSGGTAMRSLPLLLNTGDAIIAGTITVVTDPETDSPLVGDSLTVWGDEACTNPVLTWGLVSSDADGDRWGVTFYLLGGVPGTLYWLRLRYRVASQPSKDKYDELYPVLAVA